MISLQQDNLQIKLLYLHQADYLAGLADDLEVLEALEQQRQVEGDDGQHVYDVHRTLY